MPGGQKRETGGTLLHPEVPERFAALEAGCPTPAVLARFWPVSLCFLPMLRRTNGSQVDAWAGWGVAGSQDTGAGPMPSRGSDGPVVRLSEGRMGQWGLRRPGVQGEGHTS